MTSQPLDLDALTTSDPSWADCIRGVENGCESYRCGSNCSQRFDRMHPCRACLARETYRLRTELVAARAAGVREARDEIKTMLDGFKHRGRHTRARWAVEWLGAIANRLDGGDA